MTEPQLDPMAYDERVEHAVVAVRNAAVGGVEWARAVDDLAEEWLAIGDIDLAIATRRMGVAGVAGDGVRFRSDLMNNLGIDLMTRYQHRRELADLRDACRIAEEDFGTASAAGRLRAASNLAGRWSVYASLPGEQDALDRALRLITDELAAAAPDDEARSLAANTLAGIQLALWRRDGDQARLRVALRTVLAEPAMAGGGAINVIGLLSEVAEETSDLDLLTGAEELARRSLVVASVEHRAAIGRLLATVLLDRHEWTGDTAALTEAVRVSDDAVHDAEAGADDKQVARALSVRSVVRAEFGRARDDRQQSSAAIEDARAALTLARRTTRETGEYANHVAMLLAERFDLLGESDDLNEAIDLLDAELERGPDADEFAAIATNQATALLSRADLLSGTDPDASAADLDRGIELVEAAIAATAPDSAGLAARHDTAGRLWAYRNTAEVLAVAVRHAESAVDSSAPGSPDRALYLNNWAQWVTYESEISGSTDDLLRAIDLLQRALAAAEDAMDANSVLVATIRYNLGGRLLELFDTRLAAGTEDLAVLQRAADELDEVLGADHPHLTVVAGKLIGDIAWRLSLWKEGEHAFRLAMAAAGQLAGLRRHRHDKERARSGVQGIGALAALCAVRAGDVPTAAVHLEQASATLIAEAIGVRADSVTFEGIVAGARLMGRHVLLLGVTGGGGIGVVIGPDGGTRHVELPELTEDAVATGVRTFRETILAAQDDPAADAPAAADDLSRWTGAVLTPLLPLLADVQRLAVLPLGRLAWLPITTAVAELARFEPLLLVRVTPTAHRDNRSTGPRRVVVWADTGPAGNIIPGAVREARRVARCHPGAELVIHERSPDEESTAPVDDPARLDALFDVDLLHLACHCEVDVDRPQETVLHVSPPIRIGGTLSARRARHAHVVLSACDAALTGAALPDEALSAATAFLLAGVGAVTAPLWPVGDGWAPRFMTEYHAELAAGTDPPRALASVQRAWANRPRITYAPWVVTAWPDALATDQR